ncbi:membrane protease YdiL (CAAX protease family) [Brevibacterium paucivorans]|uniref:Membrane protease YdiL (CAAX protease family) n=1 Tax=Brevibacterium paucivorans TaxID=170994 RepID=A0ABS2SL26_9MICO|nr:CPBP family glutamic-type intramembrane protease [Brevibacterium paucivorans]MBM7816966.1 membrane protease YdiL (CAAX protease family) [Brevibacterium paucivorans]
MTTSHGETPPNIPHPHNGPFETPAPEPRNEPFENHYRTAHDRWWMGLVGIIATIVVFFVVSVVGGIIAVAIDIATGAISQEDAMAGKITNTPLLLFTVNLSLILGGLVAWLAHRILHKQPWSRMFSVLPRMRWKWWGLSLACTVPLFVLYMGVGFLFDNSAIMGSGDSSFTFDGTALAYLLIIVLTTPFQAAAEEVMFRSYVPRVFGSWIPRVGGVVGVIVATILFTLAHGASDPWLWAYYAVFGLVMAALTHFSGGIEAPVVVHAVNNVTMFLIALFSGDISNAFERGEGSGGVFMLFPMVALFVIAGVLTLVARWKKVETVAPVHVRPVKQDQVPYGMQEQGSPGQAGVQPGQPGQPGYAPQGQPEQVQPGQPGQIQSGQTGQPHGQVPPAQPGQPEARPQQSFEPPADPTNRQHP